MAATPPLLLDGAGPQPPPDLGAGSLLFVGTATVLLRYGGFTILTDPNFLHRGDHVHLGYGLVSRRLTDPALEIDALPPLDLCLVSHLHADHFDRVAEARLARGLPIVTTPHGARALASRGFRVTRGLRAWDTVRVVKGAARLQITATPGRHGPGLVHSLLPPVMGSMLDFVGPTGRTAFRMYITGDTLVHRDLRAIPRRFPGIDLALLHLGGTRAFGILVTMDAQQGVEMIRIVEPRVAVPIHYDDYTVFRSPLSEFQRAVEEAGLGDRVAYVARGETFRFEIPAARWAA